MKNSLYFKLVLLMAAGLLANVTAITSQVADVEIVDYH
jgi:hypothetical protein